MEKTLVLIKPDAFAKHYSGDIIKRYEEEGFRIVAMKLMKMDSLLMQDPAGYAGTQSSPSHGRRDCHL